MKSIVKKSQASVEYIVLVGFITIVLIGILGIALFYSGSARDRIKIYQVSNFANKILSSAETVFYAGEPSKSTISVYLPNEVTDIQILENSILIEIQTNSGRNKMSFTSKVPLSGTLTSRGGMKKIEIISRENSAEINQI